MSLHQCPHSFIELASEVFPGMMAELESAMKTADPFANVLTNARNISDKPGCYVVIQDTKVIYVGIAKNIRRRLRQHLTADSSGANLAVRMAAKKLGEKLGHVKKHALFLVEFEQAKKELAGCHVAYIEIENPLEMYIFEPYCAMRFNTEEFNFFDTLQILSPK